MRDYSDSYWRDWRRGVLVWLVGVAGAFLYLQAWPEKTAVNDFLMFLSAAVGICALVDPFAHPWLIRRGLRKAQ